MRGALGIRPPSPLGDGRDRVWCCWLAPYKIHPRASLRIFPPTACLRWTGTPVSDFHVQLREWASCGPRPLPHVGIYNPMRAVPRFSRRHIIPLTRTVFASGGRLLGPRGGAHLSRQMDKFLVFIVILEQNCEIVDFMAFGACQTPQARRPWRTSQPEWYSPLGAGSWGLAGART